MMLLLEALIFSLWAFGLGQLTLEQPEVSVSTVTDKSVHISCKVTVDDFENTHIYWYQQKPNQTLIHLIYILSTTTPNRVTLRGKTNKLEARKNPRTSTSILKINFVEKEDEAMYYCAGWIIKDTLGLIKVFGEGTKLIVMPPDKSRDADLSPKPTMFLPSIAETNIYKAGTYLCLLENFFPDVIRLHWKDTNGNTILESHDGKTVETNDTYMKFSWLTVNGASMNEEHKCVVKHENNKGGVDQEIIFPPINKVVIPGNSTEACLKDKSDVLQRQLTNTSAYYTYLLLLLKSTVYFAIVVFCLKRRTKVCDCGKSL